MTNGDTLRTVIRVQFWCDSWDESTMQNTNAFLQCVTRTFPALPVSCWTSITRTETAPCSSIVTYPPHFHLRSLFVTQWPWQCSDVTGVIDVITKQWRHYHSGKGRCRDISWRHDPKLQYKTSSSHWSGKPFSHQGYYATLTLAV